MLWAEQKGLEYFEKPESLRAKAPKSYFNAKKINYNAPLDASGAKESDHRRIPEEPDPLITEKLNLRMDEHFGASVNLNCSTIHIPSSIYDRREIKKMLLLYVVKQ
jgi:hypothetical protein